MFRNKFKDAYDSKYINLKVYNITFENKKKCMRLAYILNLDTINKLLFIRFIHVNAQLHIIIFFFITIVYLTTYVLKKCFIDLNIF